MSFERDDDDEGNSNNFEANYQCYSTAFLVDRDRETIENSGKIFLPESALAQLIHQVIFYFHNRKFRQHLSIFRPVLCYLN